MSNDPATSHRATVDSRGMPISPAVMEELQNARLRIGPPVAADRMWQRLFTEEDRQHFDDDFESHWPNVGTIGMWIEARGGSIESAIVEIAAGLDLMSQQTATWLRGEPGLESPSSTVHPDRPDWRPDVGELWFQGRVIRYVRVLRRPSLVHQVLDAFQADDWPVRVGNPLTQGQQQLHQVIRHLNEGIELIRFRAQEGGQAITWEQL